MSKPTNLPLFVGGFTFIEILTAISVAGILLALGIPSLQTLTQENRMTAAINTISTHLNFARSEAVKRGIGVVVCPSFDGLGCTNTLRWDSGFIMYVDTNKNRELDPEEELLKHINMPTNSIRISSTIKRKKTVYNPYGYAHGYNVTITFCDTKETVDPKAVIVNNIGRARVSDTKYDGSPLDCS